MKLFPTLPKATLRLLITLLVFIAFAIALLMVLLLTESLFNVWALLAEQSGWFIALYAGGLFLLSGFFVRLFWGVLRPKKRQKITPQQLQKPPSQKQLHEELQQASEQGIEVVAAQKELENLQQRQAAKEVHVVLFGAVSMGKSALINALLPGAEVETDPRSGTTQSIQNYHWLSEKQQALILTDMPGLFEPDGQCSQLSQDEAKRAHLVLYLCDGDLTREQYHELETLIEWQKPLALVLNKIDRYSQSELELLQKRLQEHLKKSDIPVIPVQSGGQQELIRVQPDGTEERITRTRPAEVKALTHYLESTREQLCQLHQSRDDGFLLLGQQKLENALSNHRLQESEAIVKSHTRKAIIGAMAAVTPGTDLLIQSYLGIQLVQNLGKLYDIPIQEIDIRRFINIAGKHVGKTFPMMLAIAGNVFKSFPGIGTLTGSLLHAVAYGLIFESLGKSVAQTLHTFGKLEPQHAIHLFEENLREDLEHHARKHAQMVFEEIKKQRKNLSRNQ